MCLIRLSRDFQLHVSVRYVYIYIVRVCDICICFVPVRRFSDTTSKFNMIDILCLQMMNKVRSICLRTFHHFFLAEIRLN